MGEKCAKRFLGDSLARQPKSKCGHGGNHVQYHKHRHQAKQDF